MAYFSGSAECAVVSHSPCRLSSPFLTSIPLSPLSLPPPRWELCNPPQGFQERGMWRKKLGWRAGWMAKERGTGVLQTSLLVFLLHSSFPSTLTHPPFFHSSSIKVVDKDGIATFSGLGLAVTAEQRFKGTAAIFATKQSTSWGGGFTQNAS